MAPIRNKEAKFGVLFRHWIKANPMYSGAYELKQTTGNSLPFGVLEDHQAVYLLACKSRKGVLIRVQGVNGEPDYVYLREAGSWVVIRFKSSFHIIDIEVFLKEKAKSQRKSLISSRAREISTYDQSL